jgi:ABC-type Zn uptake system ZnuABC Zn-binding protein ZnuA
LPILLLAIACGEEPATDAPAQAAPAASGSSPAQVAPTAPAASGNSPAQKSATTAVSPAATPAVSGAARPAVKTGIVTTSNIVADWVQAVGRDRVDVFSLLPPNADPHTFQPGARDITRVADAGLVLSVGLSLEAGWLDDLLKNAARDPAKIVPLGDMVDPIDFVEIFEEHGDEEPEKALGRLLIGDGERGALSVIDLESGEVAQDRFDLVERAGRIYPTKSGRFAIAVSSDANTAHLLDGGIFLEAHGDHHDLVEVPAQRLGVDLEGDRPVHLYVGGEWAAIFYDGSGDVVLVNEHELEEQGAAYVPVRFNVGPHHGAAVPLEHDLVATTIKHPDFPANPDARRPIGAEIRDMDGNVLYRAEGCPDLHGDAGNGHLAAFGCTGGVLALEAHDGEYGDVFVAAPEGSPEDFRLTSVWGYPGLDHFFALGSAVGLYLVEPEEGAMEQLIPATEELRPIQVAFSHDGEALLVVMNDGELRMYDAHDLDMLASASGFLTTPVETGFWARPHVTTAPGAVFVTDSVGDQVFQLDDHDLEVVQQWEVAGAPTKIAFVGVLGESEGHEGHGHEEKEGHDHGELDPHFWFDPLRVKQAVSAVAQQLASLDPDGKSFYEANAVVYNQELDDLHSWIQAEVAGLPQERRLLVTSHDSFQYFAQRYGFRVVGAVMPITTKTEPTAQELAHLVETIKHEGVPAVFAEKSHSQRLAKRIAEETGAKLIGGLHTGSLGEPGGEAGTYIDLMRYDVRTIVEALQ